jgi:hypothetical protein
MICEENEIIVDLEPIGTVKDIQDQGWIFQQEQVKREEIMKRLEVADYLEYEWDQVNFFLKDNKILCIYGNIPTLDKYIWKPIFKKI